MGLDWIANRNLTAAELIEQSIARQEGLLSRYGSLVVLTGKYTGRSPNDKYIVRDDKTESTVWWGKTNQAMSPEVAARIRGRITDYLKDKNTFTLDCFAGADPHHRLKVRVVTERSWHALFAHNMFVAAKPGELKDFVPEFTLLHAPGLKLDPATDSTNSEAAIILDFSSRQVLICGTEYAGEIKKSVFSILNYLLPEKGVLGMHCSANKAPSGDVAVYFGLSGTGKTTLSADPERSLIGDDEHGWSDRGVFNFEGGCYAKVIRLNAKDEPEIFSTTRQFGTVLENVVMDPHTRELDLNDQRYTENTRASYDLSEIPNADLTGLGDHPKNIVMLTCDAFGVLPPIAKLTSEQAMYHFLSGYTAKVAGTERGVTEPTAVFSTCFGAPFMARHPSVYAKLLGKRISEQGVRCWLVNTGWSGGPYGIGQRMKITWTRTLLHAALSGQLDSAPYQRHAIFGLDIPTQVADIPPEVLDPRLAWKNAADYDQKAKYVAGLFKDNFKIFQEHVTPAVAQAGPL